MISAPKMSDFHNFALKLSSLLSVVASANDSNIMDILS